MEGSSEIKKVKEVEKTEMLELQRVRGDGGMRCGQMDGGRRSVCVRSLVLLN